MRSMDSKSGLENVSAPTKTKSQLCGSSISCMCTTPELDMYTKPKKYYRCCDNTYKNFGRNEESRGADQLEALLARYFLFAEEEVDELDCEVERLVVELKVLLNLHHPVD